MILPYEDRFRVKIPEIRHVYSGVDKLVHHFKGGVAAKKFKRKELLERSREIVEDSLSLQNTKTEDLLVEFKRLFDRQASEDRRLTLLCELSNRVLGMRPYPVQVMAVKVIQQSAIAEMATGEGKTLAASLAAIMFATEKKPVHVLTSNDYLAQRDAREGRPLFSACGLSVGFVGSDTDPAMRQQIHQNDIVYTTAKEILTDYLRDRIKLGSDTNDLKRAVDYALNRLDFTGSDLTLRGLHSVIVDEADNILIDEAVIPLIISAKRDNLPLREAAVAAFTAAESFEEGLDYKIDLKYKLIHWTSIGKEKIHGAREHLPLMWRGIKRANELFNTAIYAREFLKKDEHYIIDQDKIVLIDNLTGRLMPQRNLGINLQQAVEAKEGIEVTDPTETIGRMSFQRFFRLFPKIGGMSGTVKEVRKEIWQVYHTPVVEVPTHRPVIRRELPWKFFPSNEKKIDAIVRDVLHRHKNGQPVLLGTRSVGISEKIAERFDGKAGNYRILNAVRHAEESETVALAGQKTALTIATNMAGRGTDIKLGKGIKSLGGLYVVCTEPQASRRLDRQLFGRSGRQGDPGEAIVYAAWDDILIKSFLPFFFKLPVKFLFSHYFPFKKIILKKLVLLLQEKSEAYFAKQRLSILKSDDWIEAYLNFPEQIG
ncbi:DEAD/DEAH box helicase [uncultured Desulfobacter sp.]|uniref:preprotein translocase subunit SecA n=1 Tax=uncultured Desulfobacter sp. TaxID=240139 RepID=UPI0029F56819|nr:DEAD/DEAH box helicase [uncultured Desulfobacter sp.]